MSGYGMQIVQILNDHTYQLDESMLETVLLQNSIKDLPVVVVSVAGAYRGGKSFLLNFFIRYLSSTESARTDGSWLGADSAPLVGFNWRAGVARNTTGILLWSQPFINTLPNGEKVAVLLMDTQGTFDSKSTVRDNSTIFALSTLLSSVQIYNLSKNIQEDHLQHLQLFTTYGKMVQKAENGSKAFQNLWFLVRDWPYPYDYPFGLEGGNALLEERLKITTDQPAELQELRSHLRSCFENVSCFLLPHPGLKVESPEFSGNIDETEPNFTVYLRELITSLFGTNKLSPKTMNGQKLKTGDLLHYFRSYMNIFNSDDIPTPKSIVEATIEANLLSALEESRKTYEEKMEGQCNSTQLCVSPYDLQALHRENVEVARHVFKGKKTMASESQVNKALEKLVTELENRLPKYEQINLSKLQALVNHAMEKYEDALNQITKKQPLCLHTKDFEIVHSDAFSQAIKHYEEQIKKITDNLDQKKEDLKQMLLKRQTELTMINDKHNKDMIREVFAEYRNTMNNKSTHPPIPDAEFQKAHEIAFKEIVNKFHTRRNRSCDFGNDSYREELEKNINETFEQLQAVNKSKIEQENIKAEEERVKKEQEALRIKREEERLQQERQRLEQDRIKAEQELARAEQERIVREKEAERLNQERERLEQERQRLEQERLQVAVQSARNSRRHQTCEIA